MTDDDLERIFREARMARPGLPDALSARIASDAAGVAAERAAEVALAAARDAPRPLPEPLMARILADASAVAAGRPASTVVGDRGLRAKLGAWLTPDRAAWSGLVAAGLMGLAFGIADPGGWAGEITSIADDAETDDLVALGGETLFATLWTGD